MNGIATNDNFYNQKGCGFKLNEFLAFSLFF